MLAGFSVIVQRLPIEIPILRGTGRGHSMRESTVHVERSRMVNARPERVWSLLASPAVWSLRPGASFAIDVPWSVPGEGRLWLYFDTTSNRVGGLRTGILEISDEAPGQLIRLRTRSTHPLNRAAYTLRVQPGPQGATVSVAVDQVVPRRAKVLFQPETRKVITGWLQALTAVLEGRWPWPGLAMPIDVRQACSVRQRLRAPEVISVTAQISAPAAAVWEAMWMPDHASLVNAHYVDYAARVPGTPERQLGAMTYSLHRHADGRIAAGVYVVRELTDGQSALMQLVGPPHAEMTYLLTPAGEGTRLELTVRMRHRQLEALARHGHPVDEQLQATANGLKTVVEEPVT
jgi:Polyketide cyclase / dehydrase and lipid transport